MWRGFNTHRFYQLFAAIFFMQLWGKPKGFQIPLDDCKANLSDIANKIAGEHIQVLLPTIFAIGRPGLFIRSWFWPQNCSLAHLKVNNALKDVQTEGVHVIDVESVLGKDSYVHSEYARDMLHINRRGYKQLNMWLQPFLQRLISAEAR